MNETFTNTFRLDSRCRKNIGVCVIAAGLAFAVAGAVIRNAQSKLAMLDLRAAAADRALANATRQVCQADARLRAQQAIVLRGQSAELLLQKTPCSEALAELTNALPQGCCLVDLSLDSAESADAEMLVRLTGLAESEAQIGQYLQRLGQSNGLHEVKRVAGRVENAPVRGFVEFAVELRVGHGAAESNQMPADNLTASIGH